MRHAAHRRRRPPVAVLLVTLLLATGTGVAALLASGVAAADRPQPVSAPILPDAAPEVAPELTPSPRPVTGPDGLTLLRAWDDRRAEAWARGDVDALADLYVRGSPVARRDVAALRAYVQRGLRVEGLTSQLLAVEPVDGPRGTITVLVTDRLASGRVVGRGGTRSLPTSEPVRRELTWHRVAGRWLLARIRQDPP